MNEALILFLVLIWAILLIPSALRSRSASSPHVTVGGFERAMDVLKTDRSKGGGRSLLVPDDAGRIVAHGGDTIVDVTDRRPAQAPVRRPAQREDPSVAARRNWFMRLLALTVVTLVAAPLLGGIAWGLAVLAVAATGGYVVLLRRWKLQRDEVRTVVRQLDHVPAAPTASDRNVAPPVAAGEAPGAVRLRRWDG